MKLDALDKGILNQLAFVNKNCYKISKALQTTPATVHNRVKKMEKMGIITGSQCLLDIRKLGYEVTVLINVTSNGAHLDELEKKYAGHKNVCALYDVSGTSDCVIIAKFKKISELDAFAKKLLADKMVDRTNTSLVFTTIKESLYPNPIE